MSWGSKAKSEDSRAEWERKWGGADADGKKKKKGDVRREREKMGFLRNPW